MTCMSAETRTGGPTGQAGESQEGSTERAAAGAGSSAAPGVGNGALPPGPNLSPGLMQLRLMRPEGWLESSWRRYGDYFTIRPTSDRALVLTADPAAVKQVFTGDPEIYFAGESHI